MADADRHRPRYRSRAVTDDESIRRILERQPWGVLAMVDGDDPLVTPLLYVYDPDAHAIDVHVSPDGRTATVASDGSRGAFTAASMGAIIPAWEAGEFDTEYESVVADGPVRIVEDSDVEREILARLMAKYAPDSMPAEDYRAISDDEVRRTPLLRLDIEDWSGKRNVAESDDETTAFDPDWRSSSD
jgi:nitroimidazol reductase NimA-like FMN-containing flavoprotein (pyridoxamine 5'-phosphate oxidase superfamily)